MNILDSLLILILHINEFWNPLDLKEGELSLPVV